VPTLVAKLVARTTTGEPRLDEIDQPGHVHLRAPCVSAARSDSSTPPTEPRRFRWRLVPENPADGGPAAFSKHGDLASLRCQCDRYMSELRVRRPKNHCHEPEFLGQTCDRALVPLSTRDPLHHQ
jgi:hypothetical protein